MSSAYDAEATRLTGIRVIDRPEQRGGGRVLSFDEPVGDGYTLGDFLAEQPAISLSPPIEGEVEDIADMCGLSRLEAKLAQEIWDGESITVAGQPSDRLAQLMYPDAPWSTVRERHRVKQNVKTIWRGMQAKLREQWAIEPEASERRRLCSSDEDSRRLIIGGPRVWGPQVRNPSLEVRIASPA